MKKFILLLALLMLVKPSFPIIDYVVNYEYISKELCENKAKPELQCNGKCHLMKELAKASEAEKPLSSNKKDTSKNEIEVVFYQDIVPTQLPFIHVPAHSLVANNYSNQYTFLNSSTIFHPPTFMC